MSDREADVIVVADRETSSIFSIVKRFLKNFVTVSTIYLVGYFDMSIAWLIAPVILSVFRAEWTKAKDRKRESVRLAGQNEKKVILSVVGNDLPAWVFFPDIERAEWVNRMLVRLWPGITVYTHDIIRNTVQPKIQEALENYAKLKGFEFVKIRLGTIPPRIGGIKVYDGQYTRSEIMLDVDLIYSGDCDISFTLKGISGGVKDFQVHGMLRLILKPLIPCIPFVGAVQVFFLNKPDIDFNLVGVADVLDIPGISDTLRRVIVEQISAMMVLPNKLPIVLSDTVPAQSVKTPEPAGVLRVHVVQAMKLLKKDINMLGKGKSDPYIILTMGAQEFRSETINNTVNPKWDFWCEFFVEHDCATKLNISIFDKDDASKKDDFLGRATLKLDDIFENGEIDKWVSLEDVKHGMVHLRLSYFQLSENNEDLKQACEELATFRVPSISSAVLIFFLDSIQNLPDARANKRPDPMVSITAGHETKLTGVQFRSSSPVYEQGFSFLIHNPKNESLTLRVIDQKTNTELGSLNYHLSVLMTKEGMKRNLEPFHLNKCGNNCQIVFSAQLKAMIKKPNKNLGSFNISSSNITSPPTPSSTGPVGDYPDVPETPKSQDETSHDVKSITNEDSITMDSVGIEDGDSNTDDYKLLEAQSSLRFVPPEYAEIEGSSSSILKGTLKKRKMSNTESLNYFGRIELTLNYVAERQKLEITVHQAAELPYKDPTDLPDPYVKVYLLPKSEEHKRKTKVVKDSIDPVYEETFDYVISSGEIAQRKLKISIVSQKTTFYGTNSVMGQISLKLKDLNLNKYRSWFELEQYGG